MKKLVASVLILFAHVSVAQNINLVRGELNAQSFCAMTLDETTGSLGRPTAARGPTPGLEEFQGPTLYWHHLGLKIDFRPGATGNERARTLTIYIVPQWDPSNAQWFRSYSGMLIPGADASWRVDRTLREVAEQEPEEQLPEEQEKLMLAEGFPAELIASVLKHEVSVQARQLGRVVYYHEPITRFLEDISFSCWSF